MSHLRTPEQLKRHREQENRRYHATKHLKPKRDPATLKYRKGPVPTLDRDTCLYLAGLFDGEGSFMIAGIPNRSNGYPYYSARIRIAMTHRETIEWIANKLDRPVLAHSLGKNGSKNAKPCCRVQLENCAAVASLIEQLLPFLITKREVAGVVLEFCLSRQGNLANGKGYTEHEVGLYYKARALNRTGEAHPLPVVASIRKEVAQQ